MPAHRVINLKARYVFPVGQPPVPDGIVTVEGPNIVAVGKDSSAVKPIDLGNMAILPGLVNAHTHLEFSDLTQPLGTPGMRLPDWISLVLQFRHARTAVDAKATAVGRGLAECLRAGTTTLGEIATTGWPSYIFSQQPLDCTVFFELIGLQEHRLLDLAREATGHIHDSETGLSGWRPGLSPHAPYTARPELVSRAAKWCTSSAVPVAMHLAESPEELQLLRSGDGPFLTLLEELDAWDPAAIPVGSRPLDYLRLLASAPRALVVHGNYLDDAEIQFAAVHADHLSVVYCPRSHAYFEHCPYPLARMIDAGVNVALGTDSRASNPDLSILSEMRHIARQRSDIRPEVILRMGTICGARSLGLEREIGELAAGKRADLVMVPLPEQDSVDPYELLFDHDRTPAAVMCGGILEWDNGAVPNLAPPVRG